MTKRALCVGINAYPNAPLSGCVNDANDWADLLESQGYEAHVLLDTAATRIMVLEQLREMVRSAKFGDRIVFTYSGHGSWVPDTSGDEPDGRDEVLCAFDYESGGYIRDDELQDVVSLKRFGVRITIISDSCHSGSVSRFSAAAQGTARSLTTPGEFAWGPGSSRMSRVTKPRFVHPNTFLVRPDEVRRIAVLASREAVTAPRNAAGAVLLSGCADEEFSYDAWFDGRANGAFSWYAMAAWRAATTTRPPSNRVWHNKVRELLPSDLYPQSPQMYASAWQRGWRL